MPKVSEYSLFVSLLLFTLQVFGQSLPPGVVKVDSVYIDQSEVTNINWLEYLYYLDKDSTEDAYLSALPDSSVWYQIYDSAIADPLFQSGFRFAGFRYMPIVGISQKQAADYCKWRTEAVKSKVLKDEVRNGITYFEYRLPSESEWEYVAIRNQTFQDSYLKKNALKLRMPKNSELKVLSKELKYDINIKELKKDIKQFYTHNPILLLDNLNTQENPYFKTLIGIGLGTKYAHFYDVQVENLRGNVSEITLTPGVARGGNWTLTEKESAINVRIKYEKPSPLLGFRCFCEIEFKDVEANDEIKSSAKD